jgi:CheY-like chemotaxis protein
MRTALIIDDSMLVRHTVCRYFQDRGFGVDSATNGAEGLEMLRNLTPDIIITDIQMPKMDGSQLITMLKSDPRTARIPVVVLAGRKSVSEKIPQVRADYFIFKDIDIETQLQHVLETAFQAIGA